MAVQENKERKVLYGEENNGDSIKATGTILEFILFLAAAGVLVELAARIIDGELTTVAVLASAGAIALLVFLGVKLGSAMRELGQLAEENAKLKTAVQYLLATHNIEVHSFDEAPDREIPGAAGDGYETMRIEEDGVHFRRVGATVKCPFCDREQPAGYEACEQCGQKFFFEE